MFEKYRINMQSLITKKYQNMILDFIKRVIYDKVTELL